MNGFPLLKTAAVLLLVGAAWLLAAPLAGFDLRVISSVPDMILLARRLDIRNLVTVIYLGPRLFDTFLEALIVVLAVQGILFVRSRS